MPTDPTEYPSPLEPTQEAHSNPYEPTSPYPEGIPSIPPPPPTRARGKWWHIAVPAVMVIALVALIVIPNVMTSNHQLPVSHADPGATAAAQAGATERAAATATASAPTPTPTATPTPRPTEIQVTPSGPSYAGDLYSSDFKTFLNGFIEAMTQAAYPSIGASTESNFSMYCTSYFQPACQYSWDSTYILLRQGNLHFQFSEPVSSYNGFACKTAYVHAATYIVVTFTQDGSIPEASAPSSGYAVLAFGEDYIGYNTYQWFWDSAILNATC